MNKIQSSRYEGNHCNFTLDKYIQLHDMEQHNLHNDFGEYGVEALPENLNILWFKDGIADKSFEAVNMSIITNPRAYKTFQAPLKTNKLIYWIKILLRYLYWISDAFFFILLLLIPLQRRN